MFTQSPYPGLRPYTWDESYLFFGRDEMCDQLLDKLSDTRFLAVVGESGCGKSSLIRAGVLPDLQLGFMPGAKSKWRIAQMKPGNRSFENLALSLAGEEAFGPGNPELTPDMLRRGLPQFLSLMDSCPPEKKHPLLPEDTNLLILVDQFEEIFRYMESGQGNGAFTFVSLMLDLAEQRRHNIYVIITMRTDFLGDCARFQGLPEAINQGQFLVPRLSEFQLRQAITEPAKIFDCTVEEKLVTRIMEDAGTNPDYLPLIQHALMRLYDTRKDKLLTLDEYDRLGGMEKILSNHADQAYDDLSPKHKWLAEALFRCLSAGQKDHRRDIRNPTEFCEILRVCSNALGYESAEVPNAQSLLAGDLKKVIDIFRDPAYNFLTPAKPIEIEMDTVIDISHESLIRQWARLSGEPSGQEKEKIDRERKGWVKLEAHKRKRYAILADGAAFWQKNGKQKDDLAKKSRIVMAQEWEEEERPTLDWAIRNDAILARETDPAIEEAFERHMASPRDKQLADQYRKKLNDWCKKRFDLTFEWLKKSNRSARRKQLQKTTGVFLLVTLLIAAVPAGLWFANYLNNEAIEDLIREASTAEAKDASKLYKKAIDKGDQSVETMDRLATVYMELHQWNEAVTLVENYRDNTNDTLKNLESALLLADILTKYGKADQHNACDHYKKADQLYRELCASQHLDGPQKKQALEGKLELAFRVLDSGDSQFAIDILEGILEKAQQMKKEQPGDYKKVFENEKTLAQTHLGLGTAYYREKKYEKARSNYKLAAIDQLKNKCENQIFSSAQLGLADICMNPPDSQGTGSKPDFDNAIIHYQNILKNDEDCQDIFNKNTLLREYANFGLMQARLNLFSIYECYQQDKASASAQEEYEKIMEFHIGQANLSENIQKSLTSFFLRKKELRLAMAVANQIQDRSRAPDRIKTLLYLAAIFHREKYYNEAIEFYNSALAEQNRPSDIHLSLGAIYFTKREYAKAEKSYGQFIRESTESSASQDTPYRQYSKNSKINFSKTAYAWIGKAYAQKFLKRPGDAKASFFTASEMDPDNQALARFEEQHLEPDRPIHLKGGE